MSQDRMRAFVMQGIGEVGWMEKPVPTPGPDEAAAYCCDMLSTGFAGAEHGDIPVGGTVAVFAQGPVGLMATAAARLLGAGLVIAVESVPKRQELARHYGADVVVDFTESDPVEAITYGSPGRRGAWA